MNVKYEPAVSDTADFNFASTIFPFCIAASKIDAAPTMRTEEERKMMNVKDSSSDLQSD